jgi:hypothetical protein
VFASLVPALPAPAAPLEAYGRLPSIEMAALSPDGATMDFVEKNNPPNGTASRRRQLGFSPLPDIG